MAKVAFDGVTLDDLGSLRNVNEAATASILRDALHDRLIEANQDDRIADDDNLADLIASLEDSITANDQRIDGEIVSRTDEADAIRDSLSDAASKIRDTSARLQREEHAREDVAADLAAAAQELQDARDAIDLIADDLTAETAERIIDVQQEAQARARALLAEAAARGAAIDNEATIRENADDAMAQTISSLVAGTSAQFDYTDIWYFDTSAEDWTGGTASGGFLRPNDSAGVVSPDTLAANGDKYKYIKARLRRVGNPTWHGVLDWRASTDAGFPAANTMSMDEPLWDEDGIATTGFQDIPWSGDIAQVRIDPCAFDASNYIEFDWIAVGRPSPGASTAGLEKERLARIQGDQAEASSRETLAAQMRGDYTGTNPGSLSEGLLYNEREARVSADQAQVSDIESMQATVSDPNTGLDSKASITALQQAQSDNESARSTLSDTLEAEIGDTNAAIQQNADARVTDDDALAGLIETVESSISENDARISTEQVTRAEEDTALSGRIVSVQADMRNASARIEREEITRAEENLALSGRTSDIEATLDDVGDGINSVAAGLHSEAVARANADTGLSHRLVTMRADVAGNAAAIESEQTARATADDALAQNHSSLAAEVHDEDTGLDSKASVNALQQAQSDNESARSTLQSEITAAYESADDGLQTDINTRATKTALSQAQSDNASARSTMQSELTAAYEAADSDLQDDIDTRATVTQLQSAQSDNASARAAMESALDAEIDDANARIQFNAKARVEDDDTLAGLIETIESAIGENDARINTEQITRTDENEALSGRISTVQARVRDANARIEREELTRANQYGAFTQATVTIRADVDDNTAAIQREQYARTSSDRSMSLDINRLQTNVGTNTVDIADERVARIDADEAMGQTISSLIVGNAEQFDYVDIWSFDKDAQGWTGADAIDGFLRPTDAAGAVSPAGIGTDAGKYRYVKFRMRRVGNPTWTGTLAWRAETDNDWPAANSDTMPEPEWDAEGVTTDGWRDISWAGDIDQIRICPAVNTATDYIEIDWVAVGRPSPGASTAALMDERQARVTKDQALTQRSNAMQAQIDDSSALIQENATARVEDDDALAGIIESIESSISDNDARIATEQATRTTQDQSLSSRIVTVDARVRDTRARLTREEMARATQNMAIGQRVADVEADIDTASASLHDEQTARAESDLALSLRITHTRAKALGNAADIGRERTARADADSALAEDIGILQSSVTDEDTGLASKASIASLDSAKSDLEGAIASQKTTIQSDYNNKFAAVSQTMSTKADADDVSAMYTLRINGKTQDGKELIAGWGLGIEGGTSRAIFDVNQFAVGSTGTDATYAFVVDGNRVVMNEAVIGKVTFTKLVDDSGEFLVQNGKLKSKYIEASGLQVEYAQITGSKPPADADKTSENKAKDTQKVDGRSASVVKNEARRGKTSDERTAAWARKNHSTLIDGRKIYTGDAFIERAMLKSAIVGSAEIANTLQSSNFKHNQRGWRIRKSGAAEFNDIVVSRDNVVKSGQQSFGREIFENQPVKTYRIDTGYAAPSWNGLKQQYSCTAGVSGASTAYVYDQNKNTAWWGVESNLSIVTKWSGGARLYVRVTIHTSLIRYFDPLKIRWKLIKTN